MGNRLKGDTSVGHGVSTAEQQVITAQLWPINSETCSCNITRSKKKLRQNAIIWSFWKYTRHLCKYLWSMGGKEI